MRHRLHHHRLGRATAPRKALLRQLAAQVILEGTVETTHAKAKAVAGVVDSLAHKATTGRGHLEIRAIMRALPSGAMGESASRRLYERVESATATTGFVRVLRTRRRRGDGAEMAMVAFTNVVVAPPAAKEEEEQDES